MEHLGIEWTPVTKDVADLKHWDKNPRKITEEAYARLKMKVVSEGMHQVLTVDTDETVLSGNQRLEVLKEVGVEKVWCMVPVRALTEEERDKVGLQANIIEGTWDVEMLANNFELPVLLAQGFTKLQLGMGPLKEDDFDADEEYKKIEKPVAKYGDIFQLGEHRIMCGDSTSAEDVSKLMGGGLAKVLFTDPPYGVSYVSTSKKKHSAVANDELVGDKLKDFLLKSFLNAFTAMTVDASFYSWFANSNQEQFRQAMEDAGFRYSQILVWIKPRFVLSRSDYHQQYEPCMYGWKKDQKHYANPRIRSFGNVIDLDVDTFADQLDVWFINRDASQDYTHPTQKPIRLAERALRMSTEQGDGVLDLFLGSASTLIATEQAKRICYGLELDPKYIDLAVKRFRRFVPSAPVRCLNRDVDMQLLT